MKPPSRSVNFIGKRFGKLVVVSMKRKRWHRARHWVCKCDCGRIVSRPTNHLISRSKDCGLHLPSGSDSKSWTGFGIIPGRFVSELRKRKNVAGMKFNITCEHLHKLYIKQSGRCALTGVLLTFESAKPSEKRKARKSIHGDDHYASLDRINPNKGYIKGNVQWTSLAINYMKRDHSQSEFIKLCHSVVKYQEGKVKA